MAPASNSKWAMDSDQAHNYLIDPLSGPDPSDETGLNSKFRSTFGPAPSPDRTVSPPSDASSISSSGPMSTPPRGHSRTSSSPVNSPGASPAAAVSNSSTQRSRGNSLSSPRQSSGHHHHHHHHNRRSGGRRRAASIQGLDPIDSLDAVPGGRYHHDGPFDATLLSRNLNAQYSPVAAVAHTNQKALAATPRENINDALEHHRPLDGVASVPPGVPDEFGRVFNYSEMNLMTEQGGDYKKFPGDKYNIDQIKAMEQKKKQHYEAEKSDAANFSGNATAIEMQDNPKKGVNVEEDELDDYQESSKRHSLGGLKK